MDITSLLNYLSLLIILFFSFDNFMNIKCPDDNVLKTVIRKSWWQRPTAVQGETDPRIAGEHRTHSTNILL